MEEADKSPEEADKSPEEASEVNVESENQEDQDWVSTTQDDEDSSTEVSEEEPEDSEKSIVYLLRDLRTSVNNLQSAADAKELLQRQELEEARRSRLQRLQDEFKLSGDKFEEINEGWLLAKQKEIHQELQGALNKQEELCAALIEDKEKLIDDLKHELKVKDDCYVKDLRNQAEELDLIMERIEEQIKTLTKAYREELVQVERDCQREHQVLLTKDKTEWEQYMTEFMEKELKGLMERKDKVEEYEAKIHNLILETTHKNSLHQIEQSAKSQVLQREHQKTKANRIISRLKQIKQEDEVVTHNFNLSNMMSRTISLQADIRNLLSQYSRQDAQFKRKNRYLLEDYKRSVLQYERIQKKIKHFAAADVRKFEEMWLVIEEEVKELVENALLVDSLICTKLGLAWQRPPMPFMELSGPIQPKKQLVQCSQMVMYQKGASGQAQSGAEQEQEKLMKAVLELMCDEASFLLEDRPMDQLASLEQSFVKLSSLLHSLGIDVEDLPKLSNFLVQYTQHKEQSEGAQAEGTPKLDPNHVLPALKSFLEQYTKSRENSGRHRSSVEARDASEDEAYWDSMSNIISEKKLKFWDTAEKALQQYHVVLKEISELVPETQSLEQQNRELRMLLQQSLTSRVRHY